MNLVDLESNGTPRAIGEMHDGIENHVAPGETVVHCFEFGGNEFAYFSRTADLFELGPESAVALRTLEAGGDMPAAVAAVEAIFGANSASKVENDIALMQEAGLFERERPPSPQSARAEVDSFLSHRPRNLMFFVTERCNLKCLYCYESLSGVHDNGAVLRSGDGRRILVDYFERTRGRKQVKITFFGGEPLSNWPVFREMVEFAEEEATRRGQYVAFTTTSNLTLLDEEKADFLIAHRFTVMVSIDGDEKTHDANRRDKAGRGTHAKVAANLEMLIRKTRAAGLRLPRLRATWVSGNGNRKAVEEHLLGFGTGKSLVEVGSASYDMDHMELDTTDEDSRRAQEKDCLEDIATALAGGEVPKWLTDALRKIDTELSREEPHDEPKQELCGVCRNMLAATPKGDFYPCHRYVGMSGFHLGNVRDGGLNEGKVRDYYGKVQASFQKGCGSCWARHICKGTCSWLISSESGEIMTPRAELCSGIRATYERVLGAYSVVRRDPELSRKLLGEAETDPSPEKSTQEMESASRGGRSPE